MKLICVRLLALLPRGAAHAAVLGMCLALGSGAVVAQTDAAPQPNPHARRDELRSIMRQQPGAAPVAPVASPRYLSAEERNLLRRQLSRELNAQNTAPPVSRP
jgi:hypothetical protein